MTVEWRRNIDCRARNIEERTAIHGKKQHEAEMEQGNIRELCSIEVISSSTPYIKR